MLNFLSGFQVALSVMHLCLFEDGREQQLAPLALTRPVFELVCGRFSLRERLVRAWNITEWGVILRPHLAGVYREEHPEARLNDPGWLFEAPVLLINGRWIQEDLSTFPCAPIEAVVVEDCPVALWVLPDEWKLYGHLDQTAFLKRVTSTRKIVETPGCLVSRPWDLVEANAAQLRRDFQLTTFYSQPIRRKGLEILGDERNLSVSPRTEFEPFVVLDVRRGPVTIEDGVKLQSFSRIEGPCHVGRETRILGGRISSGTTIGSHCSLAGEVENSIIHAYVDQLSPGLIGHSYLSPWVHLGAQTTLSARTNAKSSIDVPFPNEQIDTGLQTVGSFLGDYVKTSANTLFEAGSSVGPLALIHSEGRVVIRQIPAFSQYRSGQIDRDCPLEKSFEIIRSSMSQRELELTAAREMLFRLLFDQEVQSVDLASPSDQDPSSMNGRSAA